MIGLRLVIGAVDEESEWEDYDPAASNNTPIGPDHAHFPPEKVMQEELVQELNIGKGKGYARR